MLPLPFSFHRAPRRFFIKELSYWEQGPSAMAGGAACIFRATLAHDGRKLGARIVRRRLGPEMLGRRSRRPNVLCIAEGTLADPAAGPTVGAGPGAESARLGLGGSGGGGTLNEVKEEARAEVELRPLVFLDLGRRELRRFGAIL